jgi:hypothetical protein
MLAVAAVPSASIFLPARNSASRVAALRRSSRDPGPGVNVLGAEDVDGFALLRCGEFRPVEAFDVVTCESLHDFDETSLLIIFSERGREGGGRPRIGVCVSGDNQYLQVSALFPEFLAARDSNAGDTDS